MQGDAEVCVPLLVRSRATWFVDQDPLQEAPAPVQQQQHSWQQIQQPLAASSPCRPPWQGARDRGDAPAVIAEVRRAGGSGASRRTSVASIGLSSSRSRHSVENTPAAAAFTNQHLAQLAAAAAEKVRAGVWLLHNYKQHLHGRMPGSCMLASQMQGQLTWQTGFGGLPALTQDLELQQGSDGYLKGAVVCCRWPSDK